MSDPLQLNNQVLIDEAPQAPAADQAVGAKPVKVSTDGVSGRRWVQLDALRVFAMLAIFTHHFAPVTSADNGKLLGELGVQIFLALSGFLITSVLLRDRQLVEQTGQSWGKALKQFYIRRSLRVFPVYYLILVTAFVFNFGVIRDVFWWFATYTSNLYLSWAGDWNTTGRFSHLWTLAIQEQFYLAWAPFILAAPRRLFYPVALAMVVAGPAYRLTAILAGWNPVAIRCFTLSSMDTLGMGAILAIAIQAGWWQAWRKVLRNISLVFGLTLVTLLVIHVDTVPKIKLVIFNIGMGAVSCWLISGAVQGFPGMIGKLFESRPLTYLGKISYGLYVYHLFMPAFVAPVARRLELDYWHGGFMNLILSSLATLAVASLSWRFIESPLNKLKAAFRPSTG